MFSLFFPTHFQWSDTSNYLERCLAEKISKIIVQDAKAQKEYRFDKFTDRDVVFRDGTLTIHDSVLRALWGGRTATFRGGGRPTVVRRCPECPIEKPTAELRLHLREVHGWKWIAIRQFKASDSVVAYKSRNRAAKSGLPQRKARRRPIDQGTGAGVPVKHIAIHGNKRRWVASLYPGRELKASVTKLGTVLLSDSALRSIWAERARGYQERLGRAAGMEDW